jgi:basic membrane lipoprotein Med (substrate-binding protein (PBP1-ABC) superfamily)
VFAQRRLERSAKVRLVALIFVIVLLGGALVYGLVGGGAPPTPRVAMAWPNEDGMFDRVITSALDRAARDFGIQTSKFTFDDLLAATGAVLGRPLEEDDTIMDAFAAFHRAQEVELRRMSETFDLVIAFSVQEMDFTPIVRDYPATRHAFLNQWSGEPNVAHLSVLDNEGTYLAGAAAALTSETGIIGFVGGWEFPIIWRFEAGYVAGAQAVRPDIEVLVDYIGHFGDESLGEASARRMYEQGADVVMHAAGNAGLGIFEAALAISRDEGRHVWAIGVDTDQYQTVLQLPGAVNAPAWRSHILTSVVKRLDNLVYALLAELAEGRFTAGSWDWGLAEEGIDIAYSGGYIDNLRPTLENLRASIIAGDIRVPCFLEDRRRAAIELGIDPDTCAPIEAP